jgi:hypothetical protein
MRYIYSQESLTIPEGGMSPTFTHPDSATQWRRSGKRWKREEDASWLMCLNIDMGY